MLNFNDIDGRTLLARGHYATVRAAHEDAKKRLVTPCSLLQHAAAALLKSQQPDNDAVPESTAELTNKCRALLDQIDAMSADIASLAAQRQELKRKAWK